MLEYLRLTPAFRRWNDAVVASQRDDWRSYAAYRARIDGLICFTDILWPRFVEKDGLIVRESAVPDTAEEWEEFLRKAWKAGWSDSDIEYVVNHTHVLDVFYNDPDRDRIDDSVYAFLASTIADMWACRLCALFPETEFSVGVGGDAVDPEVYAYAIRRV